MPSKDYKDNKLVTLASVQPNTRELDPHPKALKYFPLRQGAKLFAIADTLMASMLLISRYFIVTRIVTFPIFQLVATSLYILVSCFGIFQVFTENTSSFSLFLLAYPIVMVFNLVSTIILGLQTFDMGLITDNCGDVEICNPHVKPLALAGWLLVAGSITFLFMNVLMFSTYWKFSNRLLDEKECGHTTTTTSNTGTFMHSHTHHHHQYSHQNYPINYSRSGGFTKNTNKFDVLDIETGGSNIKSTDHSVLRTPQPKLSAKNIFNDSEITLFTKTDAAKLITEPVSQQYLIHEGEASNDYKSLQISPLDFSQFTGKGVY